MQNTFTNFLDRRAWKNIPGTIHPTNDAPEQPHVQRDEEKKIEYEPMNMNRCMYDESDEVTEVSWVRFSKEDEETYIS